MTDKLLKEIEVCIREPWNWGKYGLSSNPSITPEFVEKYNDKPWRWGISWII